MSSEKPLSAPRNYFREDSRRLLIALGIVALVMGAVTILENRTRFIESRVRIEEAAPAGGALPAAEEPAQPLVPAESTPPLR